MSAKRRPKSVPPESAKRHFLDLLAQRISAVEACRLSGLDYTSAYNLKLRDANFREAWELAAAKGRATHAAVATTTAPSSGSRAIQALTPADRDALLQRFKEASLPDSTEAGQTIAFDVEKAVRIIESVRRRELSRNRCTGGRSVRPGVRCVDRVRLKRHRAFRDLPRRAETNRRAGRRNVPRHRRIGQI